MSKIEVKNVYKIFGHDPHKVLPMVQDGATKEDVLEKTGHTVGLDNVSISIEEGETFVCMGLSGSGKSTLIRHINRLIDPTAGEVLVEGPARDIGGFQDVADRHGVEAFFHHDGRGSIENPSACGSGARPEVGVGALVLHGAHDLRDLAYSCTTSKNISAMT